MEYAFSIVIGYLLGSISFSYLIAKKIAGIDIRSHGSGNAGATNTLRVLGKGPAILVLLLDLLKGLAALGIAYLISGGDTLAYAFAGIFAIIGHNWPVFFGFRGGKGIATTIGVALGYSPTAFLIAVIVTIIVIAITRYVSLGSLVFVTLLPILLYTVAHQPMLAAFSLLIMLFAYIRHYKNILNLLRGTERKLGEKVNKNLN
ncbi:glycerol-3-phosphate 1-O-acyltransferase PlsY [Brevibacillus fulvus]|uniref:Glycerol-3-phosphate acyltransferase n=1 Tax=Brevibacillus fulvus TaxID=1125967 RepID=A0A939BQS0_9BACL|nr:glycerol-3-phosphate 1-O-acyltransferase PlsY [Brevibacillus fulvus]MBM7588693.1 glycerol-3-phosphate acyltransferase PlsY [Brevibacillus fulvus]